MVLDGAGFFFDEPAIPSAGAAAGELAEGPAPALVRLRERVKAAHGDDVLERAIRRVHAELSELRPDADADAPPPLAAGSARPGPVRIRRAVPRHGAGPPRPRGPRLGPAAPAGQPRGCGPADAHAGRGRGRRAPRRDARGEPGPPRAVAPPRLGIPAAPGHGPADRARRDAPLGAMGRCSTRPRRMRS